MFLLRTRGATFYAGGHRFGSMLIAVDLFRKQSRTARTQFCAVEFLPRPRLCGSVDGAD